MTAAVILRVQLRTEIATDVSLLPDLLCMISLCMFCPCSTVSVTFFCNNSRPVLVRFLQIALLVLVELFFYAQVVLHQQPAIDDLKCLDFHWRRTTLRNSISAEAAELWLVFCRVRVKGGLVFSSGKIRAT